MKITNDNNISIIQYKHVSLSASDLKNGVSSPVTIIAAPGIGYAIELISASVNFSEGDTLTVINNIQLTTETATAMQLDLNGNLDHTKSLLTRLLNNAGYVGFGAADLVENKAIIMKTNADSATGTATAELYICYRIITL